MPTTPVKHGFQGNRQLAPVEKAHPLVHKLFEFMCAQGVSVNSLAKRSGVSRYVIWSWFQHRRIIKLELLENCLEVLGCRLYIQLKEELLRQPMEKAPRDGTYIMVAAEGFGPHKMRWDPKARNPIVGNATRGLWVAPDNSFTWDESRGGGPEWWEPLQ
jgi:transcriptional regulator with XRE-family HTH domain